MALLQYFILLVVFLAGLTCLLTFCYTGSLVYLAVAVVCFLLLCIKRRIRK